MNKIQKLIDALPKSFVIYESIIGLIFGILLIITTFFESATSGQRIIIAIYSIISILLYPFSRSLIFKPGKLFKDTKLFMEKSNLKSLFIMIMIIYAAWGVSVAVAFVLSIIFGSIQILRILLTENARVTWYDEFTLFSNVKAFKAYIANRVKDSF